MSDAAGPVPLARLLAMAYRLLHDALHARLRDAGWHDVRSAYGFVLLAVRGDATTTGDLAELLGTSKQASSKLLDAMEAAGYVRRTTDEADRRIKVVELAERGRELLAEVEQIYSELEQEWSATMGARGVEQTRRNLTAVVRAAHGGELPVMRPVR